MQTCSSENAQKCTISSLLYKAGCIYQCTIITHDMCSHYRATLSIQFAGMILPSSDSSLICTQIPY